MYGRWVERERDSEREGEGGREREGERGKGDRLGLKREFELQER